ncbi:hypothetical protein N24_0661 [Corynebacterium suranareeae]|uniref:Uncharacterized protein n=1 Tax=Corynebacterium suranareeae TaxID=2506452 RepID=A0A160PPR1_9CORY|nr:LppP/LprE family lipoprotein [Corynebacterium suranareeae]BAU94923.1 hypothetical protein N24_0661 [Corynebacterium suranareeae]
MSFARVFTLGSGAALLTAGLVGCVAVEERSTDTSMSISDSTTAAAPATVTSTVTAAPAPSTQSQTTHTPINPVQCNLDPRTSDFGPFLAQSRTPLGELAETPDSVVQVPDWFYHFQVGENGYDSCTELSYVVLNGSNGDAERSAGTGASIADVVVLFINGQTVASPAPFEMKTVESVTRVSDSEIEVVYGHAGGATAEGVTEFYTFTFFVDNGILSGRGDLPDGVDTHMRLFLF